MFEQEFIAAMERKDREGLMLIELPPSMLLAIISHLQLALRHPGTTSRLSEQMRREIVPSLINHLAGDDPVLRRGLEMGNDPKHDVPRGR
jgi:hypothetical protein